MDLNTEVSGTSLTESTIFCEKTDADTCMHPITKKMAVRFIKMNILREARMSTSFLRKEISILL
ncbi:hypothetical protein FQZ97_748820 [compost metagenome]